MKTEQSENIQSDIIKKTIENNFNNSDSLYVIPNGEGNWILYLSEKKETLQNPVNNINFFVFDKINNNIIYQNKYSRAHIKWHNNEQLLLIRHFGTMQKTESSNIKKYIIDIKSEKVKELNENNKSNI